jgi:membrane protein implicated in regulation of membrane protease activity
MIMNSDGNVLIQLLETMDGARWLILGVVLLVLEVLTGTTYILWVATAALIVGVLAFILPIGWPLQFLLFFALSIALLIAGHKYFRPNMMGEEDSDLNDRAKSMIGMRVKAVADFETGQGRVHVGDTQWRAAMDMGHAKAGQELRVLSVKGTTLMVENLS